MSKSGQQRDTGPIGGIHESGANLVRTKFESSFPVELFPNLCARLRALRPGLKTHPSRLEESRNRRSKPQCAPTGTDSERVPRCKRKTAEAFGRIGRITICSSHSPPAFEDADAACGPFVFCRRTRRSSSRVNVGTRQRRDFGRNTGLSGNCESIFPELFLSPNWSVNCT
jgi:hypothetical protein